MRPEQWVVAIGAGVALLAAFVASHWEWPLRRWARLRICRGVQSMNVLSDEQCIRVYTAVVRWTVPRYLGWCLLIFVASCALSVAGFVGGMAGYQRMETLYKWHLESLAARGVFLAAMTLPFVLQLLIPLGWMMVRRRQLRYAMSASACRQCRYPLAGLPESEGTIRCPECGTQQSPPHRRNRPR